VPIAAANGDPPLLLPFLLVGAALLANAGPALASTRATAGRAQYTRLVWSDEFTGSAGTAPNVRKWVHDVGTFGWTDNELQTYTTSRPTHRWTAGGTWRPSCAGRPPPHPTG
jgi:hypothetical protein